MLAFARIPTFFALAASAACTGRADTATVKIEARPVPRDSARAGLEAGVESGPHTLRVRRTMRVPHPCRTLTGDLVHVGGHLTMRVTSKPDGRKCGAGEAYLAYTATVDELPPGRYKLRVVHAHLGGGVWTPGGGDGASRGRTGEFSPGALTDSFTAPALATRAPQSSTAERAARSRAAGIHRAATPRGASGSGRRETSSSQPVS